MTFERIMVAHKIDKTRWPHHLAPQLKGRAQLAFAALPTANSDDYEARLLSLPVMTLMKKHTEGGSGLR